MVAAVLTLSLIYYAWFIFLPVYEGTSGYSLVRNIVTIITVALVAVVGIQIYFSMKKEESQMDELVEEQVKK
jgi:uncharacterized membrane protein